MPKSVRLKNVSPIGDLELPALGRVGRNALRAGEEFDCPEDLAGEAPGTWREPTAAELADNLAGLETRTAGDPPDVHREVLCPGRGLLAQVDNFVLARPAGKKQAPAGAVSTEGN